MPQAHPFLPDWTFPPRLYDHPDGRLHYVDVGQGPPLVLVHGTPSFSYEWRHLVPRLAATRRVLAVDHLGFGLSDRPRTARYRPEDHAARFASWLDAVVGAEPAAFVVHDFGGPIAWPSLLANVPRVERLTVINTWVWDMREDPAARRQIDLVQGTIGQWLYRHLNASLSLLMPRAYGDRAKLTAAVHRVYKERFAAPADRELVLYALAKSLRDSAPFFASLWSERERLADVPLQIIWGRRDGILPSTLLARWRGAFPRAVVTELAGAGHWPQEEDPDAVYRAIAGFLGAG